MATTSSVDESVELLVSDCSIKEVAYKVSYCQSSAFVEMFRRTFGTTPKAWILALETLGQLSAELHTSVSLALQRTTNP
jgi:methylphosphotriester-DNA--protein-cysteine methyltransferase